MGGHGKGGIYSMWTYNKYLQSPIRLTNRNPKMAKVIISQYGGPDRRIGSIIKIFKPKIWNARSKIKSYIK